MDEDNIHSERRFKVWMENSPNFLHILDLEGNFKYINFTIPEISVEDLLGTSVFDYVEEKDREQFFEAFELAKSTCSKQYVETVNQYGTWFNIISPIMIDEKLIEMFLITVDIRTLKSVENLNFELANQSFRLQERVKELNCLYQTSEILEGDNAPNDKLQAIANVIPPGWQFPEHTYCKLEVGDQTFLTQNFKQGDHRMESVIKHDDIVYGSITVSIKQFDGLDQSQVFLPEEYDLLNDLANKVARYLSEIDLINELDRTIAELEKRNMELEQFTFFLSHDLRGPLNSIGGFADILECDLRSEEHSDQLKYVKRIKKIVTKQHRLIDDLLEMSKAGKVTRIVESIDLRELIENLVLENNFYTKRLVMDEVICVEMDRGEAEVVIQNLFENAIKYQSERPLEIKIHSEKENGYYLVHFQDNGIGFDNEKREEIFTPFKRLKKQIQGTGLGLAICRKIMRTMGGDITASSIDTGAIFTLHFPENIVCKVKK